MTALRVCHKSLWFLGSYALCGFFVPQISIAEANHRPWICSHMHHLGKCVQIATINNLIFPLMQSPYLMRTEIQNQLSCCMSKTHRLIQLTIAMTEHPTWIWILAASIMRWSLASNLSFSHELAPPCYRKTTSQSKWLMVRQFLQMVVLLWPYHKNLLNYLMLPHLVKLSLVYFPTRHHKYRNRLMPFRHKSRCHCHRQCHWLMPHTNYMILICVIFFLKTWLKKKNIWARV